MGLRQGEGTLGKGPAREGRRKLQEIAREESDRGWTLAERDTWSEAETGTYAQKDRKEVDKDGGNMDAMLAAKAKWRAGDGAEGGVGRGKGRLGSETLQSDVTIQVEGLWWQILGEELETGAPLAWGLCLPPPPNSPPPGGLPGGGDRLSDETHYALNPPD